APVPPHRPRRVPHGRPPGQRPPPPPRPPRPPPAQTHPANPGGSPVTPGSARRAAGTLGRMLAARAGLSPVMVGRSAPLRRLTALLDEPHGDGLAASALVTGEPGVGKTRLVQELIAALAPRAVVLAGGAERGSLGRPYEVVRSLLGGPLPAADDVGRATLDVIGARIG